MEAKYDDVNGNVAVKFDFSKTSTASARLKVGVFSMISSRRRTILLIDELNYEIRVHLREEKRRKMAFFFYRWNSKRFRNETINMYSLHLKCSTSCSRVGSRQIVNPPFSHRVRALLDYCGRNGRILYTSLESHRNWRETGRSICANIKTNLPSVLLFFFFLFFAKSRRTFEMKNVRWWNDKCFIPLNIAYCI